MTCSFKTAMSVARSNSRNQSEDWIVEHLYDEQYTARKARDIVPGKQLPYARTVAAYRNGRKLYQHI